LTLKKQWKMKVKCLKKQKTVALMEFVVYNG